MLVMKRTAISHGSAAAAVAEATAAAASQSNAMLLLFCASVDRPFYS